MTEKHYPYCGGSFDRIIFDKDGSVWVPEAENAKLRELVRGLEVCADEDADARTDCPLYDEGEPDRCAKERIKRELGIEVDA